MEDQYVMELMKEGRYQDIIAYLDGKEQEEIINTSFDSFEQLPSTDEVLDNELFKDELEEVEKEFQRKVAEALAEMEETKVEKLDTNLNEFKTNTKIFELLEMNELFDNELAARKEGEMMEMEDELSKIYQRQRRQTIFKHKQHNLRKIKEIKINLTPDFVENNAFELNFKWAETDFSVHNLQKVADRTLILKKEVVAVRKKSIIGGSSRFKGKTTVKQLEETKKVVFIEKIEKEDSPTFSADKINIRKVNLGELLESSLVTSPIDDFDATEISLLAVLNGEDNEDDHKISRRAKRVKVQNKNIVSLNLDLFLSAQMIELENCSIEKLNASISLDNLTSLMLPFNKLTEIDLTPFKNLNKLDLSNNKIKDISIPKSSLIEELIVSHNLITDLETVHNCCKLRVFRANGNKITSVETFVSNIGLIEELSLSNNMISHFPASFLPFLTDLYLSYNRLSCLNLRAPSLRILSIDNNQIENLKIDAPYCVSVNLAFNKVSKIPVVLPFVLQKSIEALDLTGNQINNYHKIKTVFASFGSLKWLDNEQITHSGQISQCLNNTYLLANLISSMNSKVNRKFNVLAFCSKAKELVNKPKHYLFESRTSNSEVAISCLPKMENYLMLKKFKLSFLLSTTLKNYLRRKRDAHQENENKLFATELIKKAVKGYYFRKKCRELHFLRNRFKIISLQLEVKHFLTRNTIRRQLERANKAFEIQVDEELLAFFQSNEIKEDPDVLDMYREELERESEIYSKVDAIKESLNRSVSLGAETRSFKAFSKHSKALIAEKLDPSKGYSEKDLTSKVEAFFINGSYLKRRESK